MKRFCLFLILLFCCRHTAQAQASNNIRGFYLSGVDSWIGDTLVEDSILWYASGNAFNYIAFYSLSGFDFTSTTKTNQLAAFIRRAKTSYGIEKVGAIGENSSRFTDDVLPYNNSRTNPLERFDVFNFEFEWWNSSSIANFYCSKYLTPNGLPCDTAGAWAFAWSEFKKIDSLANANGLLSEDYLGWPDQGRMQDLCTIADRILLHSYRIDDSDVYSFTRTRLTYAASLKRQVTILPIFCAKPAYMGPWLDTNSIIKPYQTYSAEFAADTGAFKQYINLQGYQWFSYTYLPKRIDAVAIISPSGSTNLCQGQTVTLSANQGASYLWSNGQTTRSITVGSGGTFTVRVTNSSGGSTTSAPVTVAVSPTFATPTITSSGPLSFCPGGSVTLTSSSLVNNRWSNGDTTRSTIVTSSGNYYVTVTNGACSINSSPVSVSSLSAPAVPTVSANGPLTICQGSSLVLTSSSTTGNRWTTGATTQSITVSASGNYSVTVTGSNGCSSTSSPVSVSVLPSVLTPTITASGPTTFCIGGSVVLTSSATGGNTWSNGSTTQSITVTSSGSYTVSVTNGSCPAKTSSAVTVTVNGTAPIITASGPLSFCQGGSVILTSNVNSGNRWSTGSNNKSITVTTSGTYTVAVTSSGCTATSLPAVVNVYQPVTTPTITASGPLTFCQGGNVTLTSSSTSFNRWSNGDTSRSVSITNSGSYTVTVNNGYCTAYTSTPVSVTVNPLPARPVITAGGSLSFCSGGSVNLTSSVASNIQWSTGATTASISVTASGNYVVTANTTAGCSATSTVTSVVVHPSVAVPTITAGGPLTFCQGGSVSLTSSSFLNNLWSQGDTARTIVVRTAGTYTVSNSNGYCTSTSAPVVVSVTPAPTTPTISANGPLSFCQGSSVRLTSSATSNNRWSTGSTSQSITVTTGGTYSVTYTSGGCSATSTGTVVTVFPSVPTPTISAGGPLTFCQGGSVTLTSSASSGNTWSNGATSRSITVSNTGSYTVTTTNGYCTATSTATAVTVNPIPSTPTIIAGGPLNFCQGGSVTLTSSASSGNRWSNNATTSSINVTSSGNFSVTVTSSGCSATSAPVVVSVLPFPSAPVIAANGSLSFCQGGTLLLSCGVSGNLLWSTGDTSSSISVNNSGNYSVSVTNANGCTATSSPVSVSVLPAPTVPTISAGGPVNFCPGGMVVLTASVSPNYLWSNGSTTRSILVAVSDTFNVTVAGTNGCNSTSHDLITYVYPATAKPVVQASGSSQLSYVNPSVTLTPSTTGIGYSWSNGAHTRSLTVSSPGSYYVSVIDSNGCNSISAAFPVSNKSCTPPKQPVISINGPNVIATGQSVTLTSTASNAYLWSNGSTGQSATVSNPGTYTVTVSISPGCSATSLPITLYFAPTRIRIEEPLRQDLLLYPNPAKNEVRMLYHSISSEKKIVMITDLTGRSVYTEVIQATEGKNEQLIDLTNIAPGVYSVTLIGTVDPESARMVRE